MTIEELLSMQIVLMIIFRLQDSFKNFRDKGGKSQ